MPTPFADTNYEKLDLEIGWRFPLAKQAPHTKLLAEQPSFPRLGRSTHTTRNRRTRWGTHSTLSRQSVYANQERSDNRHSAREACGRALDLERKTRDQEAGRRQLFKVR